ncbi:hypothetical protein TNCV_3847291 [Trichonephila clavipes]|nr:hypothetical protein TNCV_3847291 [Trichonephila clavipes]
MRILNRSRQNDRLRVMFVLVDIDITPPHAPLPVFRRIGERTYTIFVASISYHVRVTNEARKVRSGYPFRSERMRVLKRSCQNDRLRVMLVLVDMDITPLQMQISGNRKEPSLANKPHALRAPSRAP